jgi:hypothetical protein
MICPCGVQIDDALACGPVRCSCGRWYHVVWPAWAKAVSRWRASGDGGVGDTFHRLATAVGADRVARLITWFGIDCGCEGRRELWNQMYSYDASTETTI